jgi:hypothetical protein
MSYRISCGYICDVALLAEFSSEIHLSDHQITIDGFFEHGSNTYATLSTHHK